MSKASLDELELDDSERGIPRRVLSVMEKRRWLVFDDQSFRWYPGEKVRAEDSMPVQTPTLQTTNQCSKCVGDILPDDSYVDIRRIERSADNAPPRVKYATNCVDCDGGTL
jgi:hypothetical protein